MTACSWCGADLVEVANGAVQAHKVVETDTELCPGSSRPPRRLSDEDERLLANWLAGPGRRPTQEDRERWVRLARAHPCPDHPGETAHNCRCCAADRKASEAS